MALPYETLKKRSQFLQVARQGRRCFGSVCTIQFLAQSDAPVIRVGFTATKRLGNAVVRNRAKRRLRAVIFDLMKKYALSKGTYVLIAQKDLLILPYESIFQQMGDLLVQKKWGAFSNQTQSTFQKERT